MILIARRSFAFLVLLAAALSCGDYSSLYGTQTPPDTSFEDGRWAPSGSEPSILRLSPDQLSVSASVTPAAVITAAVPVLTTASSGMRIATRIVGTSHESVASPSALAFDSRHRLWVASSGTASLIAFDSAQLAVSEAPVPVVTLAGVGHAGGLAFDSDGALWVSDLRKSTISKYAASALATSGTPKPEVVIQSHDGALANPFGLAFDAAGTLWVANLGKSNVVAYHRDQLAASGSPTPDVVLLANTANAIIPVTLAFDTDGSLWVVGVDGVWLKYPRTALAESGSPNPSVRLFIDDHSLFVGAALWPKPAGLPL